MANTIVFGGVMLLVLLADLLRTVAGLEVVVEAVSQALLLVVVVTSRS